MVPSTYLERGLTVLEARLQAKQPTPPSIPLAGAQPFVTLGRETGAGATTVGQLLVPLLDQAFGAEEGSNGVRLCSLWLTWGGEWLG